MGNELVREDQEGRDLIEQDQQVEVAPRSSRKRFLRQIGVTMLAAVGAGALARSAFATNNCCANSSCGVCQTSQGNGLYCFCSCPGGGSYCSSICIIGGSGCVMCPC
jgi:hypothetical protein